MAINLQELFTTLGGYALFLGAAGWLIRKIISSGLERDAEAFRIALQAASDKEIERLRNSLHIAAEESRIRFSNLHEKRAQIIAELYKRIAEQAVAAEKYQWLLKSGVANPPDAFTELQKDLAGLYLFFETNRIYLPESLCVLLENCVEALRKTVSAVWANENTGHIPPAQKQQAFMVVFNKYDGEIRAARRALEDEFRKMLGVKTFGLT